VPRCSCWRRALLASPAYWRSAPQQPADPNIETVRALLQTPDADIDLAKAKLTIDRMIDPTIDKRGGPCATRCNGKRDRSMLRRRVEQAHLGRAALPHLSASPWNGNRPFRYDLDDPFGANNPQQAAADLPDDRKGKLHLDAAALHRPRTESSASDVTAARAPQPSLRQVPRRRGTYYNLEATSGAGFSRDVWMRQHSR